MFNQSNYVDDVMANQGANMSCIPVQTVWPQLRDKLPVQIIFGAAFMIIFLTGLIGNLLVLYCIFWRHMQFSVRNIFIVSLAVSDLCIGLTSLPVTSVTNFSREWHFGDVVCQGIGCLQGTCIFASSFVLAAIAIDRYTAIVHFDRYKVRFPLTIASTLLIWTFGIFLSSPTATMASLSSSYLALIENNSDIGLQIKICGEICQEVWPDEYLRRAYGVSVLVLQYVIPGLITIFCYTQLARQVSLRVRKRCKEHAVLPETNRRLQSRRVNANRMTSAMVLTFMLSWLPLNLVNLLDDFNMLGGYIPVEVTNAFYTGSHLIAMTSIIWNPLIYSCFNEPFRKLIRISLGCAKTETSAPHTTNLLSPPMSKQLLTTSNC